MQPDHLVTLLAIVDAGSFEAAAAALHVTPSAVSQRIKALEAEVGQVVVTRGSPCAPTDAGGVLLRLARQVQLLEADARAALGGEPGRPTPLSVAVNADSLATWFVGVLDAVAAWRDAPLRLEVEDQEHSAAWLRSGRVMAAVTTAATPVAGCRVRPLGVMRYHAVATAALAREFAPRGVPDWAQFPVVRFNDKDELQNDVLRRHGVSPPAPAAQVPSSEGFAAAVRAGIGWGLVPVQQLGDDLASGRLVLLDPAPTDVALHWQEWKLSSPRLARLADAVARAARAALVTT